LSTGVTNNVVNDPEISANGQVIFLGVPFSGTNYDVFLATPDATPPVLTITATPETLWPPNGKLVPVTITGSITDEDSNVDAITATYEVTDEYGLIQPSGQITTWDASGRYSFRIQLQASRNGSDRDGRQYTITVSAQDSEGNMGSADTIVTVPHD
jgi:hypothetical protein